MASRGWATPPPPDSRSLVHIAETPVFDVVRTPLDGSAVDTLLRSVADKVPTSVGPDGRSWAFVAGGHVFVRDGNDAPCPIALNGNQRFHPVISPDGRWIAYTEVTKARGADVCVQSMTGPARQQLFSGGGAQPR